MSRSEFVENLYSLPRVYSSEIYTSADIATKIAILQSGKPNFPQKEVTKWKRVHERFKLLSYQGTNILYLPRAKKSASKVSSFDRMMAFCCTQLRMESS